MLQDGGLWRYAGTLTAGGLEPAHAAAALERWASHVQTVRNAVTVAQQPNVTRCLPLFCKFYTSCYRW